MSKYFTRLFEPFRDTGPDRDGAPLVPDPDVRPREGVPAPTVWPIPTGLSHAQVIAQHGDSLGQIVWEAESRLRVELAGKVRDIQQRLSAKNSQVSALLVAGEPRVQALEAGAQQAYDRYLAATAEAQNARVALNMQVGPLRGEIEELLRELHRPVRLPTWKAEKPDAPVKA